MPERSRLRILLVTLVALGGFLLAAPSFMSAGMRSYLPEWLAGRLVVLGLDLQGGSRLVLAVDRTEVETEWLGELRKAARELLFAGAGIRHRSGVVDGKLNITLNDAADMERAVEKLAELQKTEAGGQSLTAVAGQGPLEITRPGPDRIYVTITDTAMQARLKDMVGKSIEVVRRRVDELGTTEPSIQAMGNDRLVVEVPGFGDIARLREIISETARLTLRMVHPEMGASQAEGGGVPAGWVILPSRDGGRELVREEPDIGGESITTASSAFDSNGSPAVVFSLDTKAALVFSKLTLENTGRRFAIVLDDTVISAPRINEHIPGGNAQITGRFSVRETTDMALLLRAGALPATLLVEGGQQVGPSLGAASVEAGRISALVGAGLVIIFMALVYRRFGIMADVALVVNIALILAIMATLGATMTLPGIAGIVLTIGMAVDANVLIFERIREESQAGREPGSALDTGFSMAFATILDANITTFIVAIILFVMGSGPVSGFAVTLAIGIVTTVFTAYTLTGYMVGYWYDRNRPKVLKTGGLFTFTGKIPVMRLRALFMGLSVAAMVASLALFAVRGLNYGIDFLGGSNIEARATGETLPVAMVRERIAPLGLGDFEVIEYGGSDRVLIRLQTQEGGGNAQMLARDAVEKALTDIAVLEQVEIIGPRVSGELATAGTIALVASMLAILLYIWFRFEWQFALGAILALVHDVTLTVGLFSFTWNAFSLASIAAILTIVGYSINDTVVVYDRVRENMRRYRKTGMSDIIDISISQTLSRTTLTSLTTMLALVALWLFGGETLRSFTFALIWGILVGTYSSIFIAAPLLLLFRLDTSALDQPEKPKTGREDGAVV